MTREDRAALVCCRKVVWRRMILRNAAAHRNRPCLFCPKFSKPLEARKTSQWQWQQASPTRLTIDHWPWPHRFLSFFSTAAECHKGDRRGKEQRTALLPRRPIQTLDRHSGRDRALIRAIPIRQTDADDGRWTWGFYPSVFLTIVCDRMGDCFGEGRLCYFAPQHWESEVKIHSG